MKGSIPRGKAESKTAWIGYVFGIFLNHSQIIRYLINLNKTDITFNLFPNRVCAVFFFVLTKTPAKIHGEIVALI